MILKKGERDYPENGLSTFLENDQILTLIKQFLERGETSFFDFKSERLKTKDLAKIICAMANTNAGIVILGVEENSQKPLKGVSDIKGWKKKINQIATNSFGISIDLKCEIIQFQGISNPFILIHVPLCSKEIWYNGRFYYRRNDETTFFGGDVQKAIKQQQDEKIKKILGFSAIHQVLFTFIKWNENSEDDIKKIKKYIELESLSEDVIPKEIALIVSSWNLLKLKVLSNKMEKKTNLLKKLVQLSDISFILHLIFILGIWFIINVSRSLILGFYAGVKVNDLFMLSFLYLFIATVFYLIYSRYRNQVEEEKYDKIISPFRFPDINKINELILGQKYEQLNNEIARIVAHMKFHIMTKYFETNRSLEIGYDSNFDPYYPSKRYRKWLEKMDTSLSSEISYEIILKSRVFNIAFFFSKYPNKIKIVSDILGISQDEVQNCLDLSPNEKKMILKYDRYYYLFNLDLILKSNNIEVFWEETQVQFSGFLVGERVKIIDT